MAEKPEIHAIVERTQDALAVVGGLILDQPAVLNTERVGITQDGIRDLDPIAWDLLRYVGGKALLYRCTTLTIFQEIAESVMGQLHEMINTGFLPWEPTEEDEDDE